MVRKVQRVQLVMMAHGVVLAQLAQLDLQGPVVKRENPDPKDHTALQDPEDRLDLVVTPVPSVLLDLPGHLALMVNLELKESLESQVRRETLGLQDPRDWLVPMDLPVQLVLLD